MTHHDEHATKPENDEDALRNPGGEAADAEADVHGDRLAEPTHVEQGDDEPRTD